MDAMAMAFPQRTTSVISVMVKAAGLKAGISGMSVGVIESVHIRTKKKQTKSVENMHDSYKGTFDWTHDWLRVSCPHNEVEFLRHLLPGREHERIGNYRCLDCGMQICKEDYEFLQDKRSEANNK